MPIETVAKEEVFYEKFMPFKNVKHCILILSTYELQTFFSPIDNPWFLLGAWAICESLFGVIHKQR